MTSEILCTNFFASLYIKASPEAMSFGFLSQSQHARSKNNGPYIYIYRADYLGS
jgi:hypothetical protein